MAPFFQTGIFDKSVISMKSLFLQQLVLPGGRGADLSFNISVGPDRGSVLVGEGGELQAVEGEDALAHVLLRVVPSSTLAEKK